MWSWFFSFSTTFESPSTHLNLKTMVKQEGKSKSSKKVEGGALSMVSAKGAEKSNPWNDSQVLSGAEGSLAHSNAQAVQNLPDILANDEILASILQPRIGSGPIKLGQMANVTPLKVSYGGISTEQSGGGSTLVTQKVHKNQRIQYDRSKGFVSTSWANFLMDPEKAKEAPLTTQKNGLFIRHVTSTVVNPNELFKGKVGKGKMKGGGVPPSVNVDSLSFTEGGLQSNTWTNVIMYQPKEQIFKCEPASGSAMPKREQSKSIKPAPSATAAVKSKK